MTVQTPDTTLQLRMFGVISLVLLLATTGCATMSGAVPADPQAQWDHGRLQAKKGEALVQRGQERLSNGRKQVRDGEAMISEGNEAVERARLDYQARSLAAGGSATPDQVDFEGKNLRKVADRWKESLAQIRAGNSLVGKGSANIDKGQAEIREGRAMIEAGSTLMRNGERELLERERLARAAEEASRG